MRIRLSSAVSRSLQVQYIGIGDRVPLRLHISSLSGQQPMQLTTSSPVDVYICTYAARVIRVKLPISVSSVHFPTSRGRFRKFSISSTGRRVHRSAVNAPECSTRRMSIFRGYRAVSDLSLAEANRSAAQSEKDVSSSTTI